MNDRRALLTLFAAAPFAPVLAQGRREDVPFVVTPPAVVEAMLDLAGLKAGERLIDLGSGDGRIALAAARRGAEARGVDINPELVERARRRAELEGLQARVRFSRGDLFEAAIRDADVVTLYLLTRLNERLRPKLLNELRPGARVVSHAFDMGDWRPDGQHVVEDKQIYLWMVPAVVGGAWRLVLPGGRVAMLDIAQNYQRVGGTLDGQPVDTASLRGDRLFFRASGADYHGLVGDRTITADPAAPSGAADGWRAERSS